jgi:hypothetical protein
VSVSKKSIDAKTKKGHDINEKIIGQERFYFKLKLFRVFFCKEKNQTAS